MNTHLDFALRCAAIMQFAVAVLNLFLVRIMNWAPDLARAPLLIRDVFHIHIVFISITLATFAVLTWRFVNEIAFAVNPIFIWFAAAIGIFWSARSIMQWLHYSPSHWRGNGPRTTIHWLLFLGYATLAVIYFTAAFRGNV